MSRAGSVTELRLVVTATNFDGAVTFFRDALGLPDIAAVPSPDGRVVILDAGRVTPRARRPGARRLRRRRRGRMAISRPRSDRLRGADAVAQTRVLEEAGARVNAPPTPTPWRSMNARLLGPEGIDFTLFSPLDAKREEPAANES
jgi:hypothetical protein